MMGRFCRYVDKVFHFGQQLQTLSDTRLRPQIPAAAVFASAWGLFATGRGSLNRFDKEARLPSRLARSSVLAFPAATRSAESLPNWTAGRCGGCSPRSTVKYGATRPSDRAEP